MSLYGPFHHAQTGKNGTNNCKKKNQNTIFLCPNECLLSKLPYTVNTVLDLSNDKAFVAIQ